MDQSLGSWVQIAVIKKTVKEEEQRHRQTTSDMARKVTFSTEKYLQQALNTLVQAVPNWDPHPSSNAQDSSADAVGMHGEITGHRERWSVQVEELRRTDAEQRDRLKTNLAVLAELQREVAHWRSRMALAAREWAEREESLATERAGMTADLFAHVPATAIALTLCLLAAMMHGHCRRSVGRTL